VHPRLYPELIKKGYTFGRGGHERAYRPAFDHPFDVPSFTIHDRVSYESFVTLNFNRAMERVWSDVEAAGEEAGHNAHFTCALALAWPDNGQTESFEGKVFGTLTWPPRGDKGFGYDPMFVPAGYERTFGEFEPEEKHAISHRAEAFRKLVAALS
jgi:non-canonical purine NTP pyrophosphatase (RdgB/HAM1 family)